MSQRFFQKRTFKLSVNIFGLGISVIGVVLCILLVVSSLYSQNLIMPKISRVDRQVEVVAKIALTELNNLEEQVEKFQIPEQLDSSIESIVLRNIDRLESLNDRLKQFNLVGILDDEIAKVDGLIAGIDGLKEKIPNFTQMKQNVINKIQAIEQNIKSTWNEYKSTSRDVRLYINLSVYFFITTAAIFFIGQISLFRRTRSNLSNLKRLKSAS